MVSTDGRDLLVYSTLKNKEIMNKILAHVNIKDFAKVRKQGIAKILVLKILAKDNF